MTIEVGRNSQDKLQLAMDAMLGVKEALKDKTVRPFRGIREAFQEIAGIENYADFLSGGFYLTKETVLTTDFPNVLKNSMTKRLIQDYAEVGMGGVEQLISETEVADFKTQDRPRLGYYGDLPTVAENAPYSELTKPTDEIINYAVAKRGGFQDVTWETILNDDLGKISSFASRLARAARLEPRMDLADPALQDDSGSRLTALLNPEHVDKFLEKIEAPSLTARLIAIRKADAI